MRCSGVHIDECEATKGSVMLVQGRGSALSSRFAFGVSTVDEIASLSMQGLLDRLSDLSTWRQTIQSSMYHRRGYQSQPPYVLWL